MVLSMLILLQPSVMITDLIPLKWKGKWVLTVVSLLTVHHNKRGEMYKEIIKIGRNFI